MDRKRVLFVDDEPMVLRMLERMMRTAQGEWESVFVASGQAALQQLESTSFDAVVSDMRMPQMDGAQLLQAVRERQPRTVRFILSGYADRNSACRCAGATHQFLSKPLDLDTLRSTLRRALGLQSLLQQKELQTAVSRISALPVLPALYAELMDLLGRPNIGTLEVGQLVAREPALAAKILKLVNSPFFGFAREISEIHEAVNYLGIETLKALVLSFGVFDQFERGRVPAGFMENLWEHSLATAGAARAVAAAHEDSRRLQDESFTAGLLHDLGKLVLAAEDPSLYPAGDAGARALQGSLAREQERFGAGHDQVGAYLLGLWGLPIAIVEAVALHHRPLGTAVPQFGPLTAVHVANTALQLGPPDGSPAQGPDLVYLRAIGCGDSLEGWREAVTDSVTAK